MTPPQSRYIDGPPRMASPESLVRYRFVNALSSYHSVLTIILAVVLKAPLDLLVLAPMNLVMVPLMAALLAMAILVLLEDFLALHSRVVGTSETTHLGMVVMLGSQDSEATEGHKNVQSHTLGTNDMLVTQLGWICQPPNIFQSLSLRLVYLLTISCLLISSTCMFTISYWAAPTASPIYCHAYATRHALVKRGIVRATAAGRHG